MSGFVLPVQGFAIEFLGTGLIMLDRIPGGFCYFAKRLDILPSAAGRRTVAETVVVPVNAVNLSSDSLCLHTRVLLVIYCIWQKACQSVCER